MNGYRAPWWLPGRHLQTLVPSLIPWPWITYTRERWPTPDGRDFIDVHWAGPENAPRLLVRFYGKHFLANNLRWKALRKLEPDMFPGAYDRCRVNKASVLSEFEDAVTAPVNGFLDAHDYWARSSAGQFFNRIAVDTLALNARNDPFLPDHVLRGAERRRALIPPNVQFEFPAEGGHAGFADGAGWLGNRVADFLAPL